MNFSISKLVYCELCWRWTFHRLQKFAWKKIRRIRTGKTTFNFHGIFHIDAGKRDSAGEPRSFKLFLLFTSFVLVDRSFVHGRW